MRFVLTIQCVGAVPCRILGVHRHANILLCERATIPQAKCDYACVCCSAVLRAVPSAAGIVVVLDASAAISESGQPGSHIKAAAE